MPALDAPLAPLGRLYLIRWTLGATYHEGETFTVRAKNQAHAEALALSRLIERGFLGTLPRAEAAMKGR